MLKEERRTEHARTELLRTAGNEERKIVEVRSAKREVQKAKSVIQ